MLTVPNHPSIDFLKRLSGKRNAPPQASGAIAAENMAELRRFFTQFGHNYLAACVRRVHYGARGKTVKHGNAGSRRREHGIPSALCFQGH